MKVYWLGGLNFEVSAENTRIVFNPTGMSDADYIFASNTDMYDCYYASKVFIKENFEYSDNNIEAKGILSENGDDVIHTFNVGGISVAHFGCGMRDYSKKTVDKIGQIDIAFIPIHVEGKSISAQAKKIMDAIDVNIVIPMVFTSKMDENEQLPSLTEFLDEIKGEYDYSYIGKDYFEIEKAELKKRTRVIIMHIK